MSQQELLRQKKQVFQEFVKEKRPKFVQTDYVGRKAWNNATVLASSLYVSEYEEFKQAHRCFLQKPWNEFFIALEQQLSKGSDPFQALKSMCPLQEVAK